MKGLVFRRRHLLGSGFHSDVIVLVPIQLLRVVRQKLFVLIRIVPGQSVWAQLLAIPLAHPIVPLVERVLDIFNNKMLIQFIASKGFPVLSSLPFLPFHSRFIPSELTYYYRFSLTSE